MSQNPRRELRVDIDLDDTLIDTCGMISRHFSTKYDETTTRQTSKDWASMLPDVSPEKITDIVWKHDVHEIFNPRKVMWMDGAKTFLNGLLELKWRLAKEKTDVIVCINTSNPLEAYVRDLIRSTQVLSSVIDDVTFAHEYASQNKSYHNAHVLVDNDAENIKQWVFRNGITLMKERFGIHIKLPWDVSPAFNGTYAKSINHVSMAAITIQQFYDREYR